MGRPCLSTPKATSMGVALQLLGQPLKIPQKTPRISKDMVGLLCHLRAVMVTNLAKHQPFQRRAKHPHLRESPQVAGVESVPLHHKRAWKRCPTRHEHPRNRHWLVALVRKASIHWFSHLQIGKLTMVANALWSGMKFRMHDSWSKVPTAGQCSFFGIHN